MRRTVRLDQSMTLDELKEAIEKAEEAKALDVNPSDETATGYSNRTNRKAVEDAIALHDFCKGNACEECPLYRPIQKDKSKKECIVSKPYTWKIASL